MTLESLDIENNRAVVYVNVSEETEHHQLQFSPKMQFILNIVYIISGIISGILLIFNMDSFVAIFAMILVFVSIYNNVIYGTIGVVIGCNIAIILMLFVISPTHE